MIVMDYRFACTAVFRFIKFALEAIHWRVEKIVPRVEGG